MRFTRARVAAAVAALLFFCAPSVHATVAIDKSNCRTFDLGAFPADLSRMARVFTRRAWLSRVTPCGFHPGVSSREHVRRKLRRGKPRAWTRRERVYPSSKISGGSRFS